ncbi:hypothetical protein [Tomitella fengzijianii]|uniref:hypothetical protein n=1 Tax=Tomitella fengzijianii TaxID=2597660 RepID=UPI00131CD201|nr:hypothetical protein [Tomitella fengzijianii]
MTGSTSEQIHHSLFSNFDDGVDAPADHTPIPSRRGGTRPAGDRRRSGGDTRRR